MANNGSLLLLKDHNVSPFKVIFDIFDSLINNADVMQMTSADTINKNN